MVRPATHKKEVKRLFPKDPRFSHFPSCFLFLLIPSGFFASSLTVNPRPVPVPCPVPRH